MSLDLNRVAPTAPLHLPLARTRTPGRVPTKPKTTVSDRANVGLPRKLRTAIASGLMGAAAIGGVGAATTSADAGIVRDPYSVWDPYARAQGQNYLVGGPGLQGGGAVHLRITGGIGTRNASAIFLGNYHDTQQGGVRALFLTAQHNISDFDGGASTSTVRTGTNYNSDPGQILNVNRWIIGDMSAPRNPGMRDYAFFWGDTTIAGNNIVLGQVAAGDVVAMVGNGQTGSEGTGNLGKDGYMRAVYSRMDSSVDSPFNPAFYRQALCSSSDQINGLGRTTGGYSGALVSNQQGETWGMVLAGTNGWQLDGATYIYDFANDPVFHNQFNSIIPAPSAMLALGLAAGVVGSRRRR